MFKKMQRCIWKLGRKDSLLHAPIKKKIYKKIEHREKMHGLRMNLIQLNSKVQDAEKILTSSSTKQAQHDISAKDRAGHQGQNRGWCQAGNKLLKKRTLILYA